MRFRTILMLCLAATLVAGVAAAQAPGPGGLMPNPPGAGFISVTEGTNLLSWDDGGFETGWGCNTGTGQMAMRFGSGAATTALVPFQLVGAYWGFYPGLGPNAAVNVNFFHPLVGGVPTGAPIAQTTGAGTGGVTQFASLTSGPVISTANGSVMVSIGVPTVSNPWFIGMDTTAGNNRRYGGCFGGTQYFYGSAPLSGLLAGNHFVRLLVDGNVPVELERFGVE